MAEENNPVAETETKIRFQTPGIEREVPMIDNKLAMSMKQTFNGRDDKGGIDYNLYYIFVIAPNIGINTKIVKKAGEELGAGINAIHGHIKQLIQQKQAELTKRGVKVPTKSNANRVVLTFHTPIAKRVINVFESANELTELYTLLWADEAFDTNVFDRHKHEVRKLLHQILKGIEDKNKLVRRVVLEKHTQPEQSVSELVAEQNAAEKAAKEGSETATAVETQAQEAADAQ